MNLVYDNVMFEVSLPRCKRVVVRLTEALYVLQDNEVSLILSSQLTRH
jgi:hypothetical protein